MSNPCDAFPYGFRIAGDTRNDRRLITWSAAFLAYCECDERADTGAECYLSAFCFGDAFRRYIETNRTTKGYIGESFAIWLWFDIDREDFEQATIDARRLACGLGDRYAIDDELLVFFSGSKGYHLGLPTSLWEPLPGPSFSAYCRAFAESIASLFKVGIDASVYDRVRAFRAPNSKHPKTGLHKRRVLVDELLHLEPSRLRSMASEPEPFDLPRAPRASQQAIADWKAAVDAVDHKQTEIASRRAVGCCPSSLNRSTLDFIREGSAAGDRARSLFSAAANLAEFGCSFELASALLSESALDSGLPPNEVRRQIECGIRKGGDHG
ncbi:MAG: hypothetical protein LW850_17215 [Planctomycetaceae bacterium]|jgi:hypothetical protein|nr:hypothetical protein [Planctomycetaceae bacterium]